jgi:hypothetical protein
LVVNGCHFIYVLGRNFGCGIELEDPRTSFVAPITAEQELTIRALPLRNPFFSLTAALN